MSFQFDTLHISHQLTTGIGYPYCFGLGEKIIRGSVYLDGPSITGDENTFRTVEGSVMIGPCNNEDSPLPWICDPLFYSDTWQVSPCGVIGIGNEKGNLLYNPYSLVVRSGPHTTRDLTCVPDGAGPGSVVITESKSAAMFIGDVDIYGYTRIKEKLSVDQNADFNQDIIIRQDVIVGSDVVAKGNITAEGEVKSQCGSHVLSAKKDFDIPHPTKEGWRLTHACVEGPEAAVYIRGRVKNRTEIDLPEYWKSLVDIQSITVNLTPIGSHQDIIVKRWDGEKFIFNQKVECL
jgi:hypothetical protein